MGAKYTSLKLLSSVPRNYSGFTYDLKMKYKNRLFDKPTPHLEKILIENGTFNVNGSSTIIRLPSNKYDIRLEYLIWFDGELLAKEEGKISTTKSYGITTHPLKTTHGTTNTNPDNTIKVQVPIEKKKFIVICGGRGMGEHNQGANFLNCAKYHIEEIKRNSFPGIPKFNPSTCEIISHIDVYNMGGYTVFTEDDGTRIIDGFEVPDGYHGKKVPLGEIHRIKEFNKIFEYYKRIKYIAYFGHSWANTTDDGYLLLGDRNTSDTNLVKKDIANIETKHVLPNAQLRFFGCRGGFTSNGIKPIAELFARHFNGRGCYGWAASGGSIFTHDEHFGHTGIQPSVDPNSQKVDTNKKKSWLAANGKPEGWKMFRY